MSTKAFLIVIIAVAALLAAGVYMHWPRARGSANSSVVHGSH
jgi:hypothetical protein